MDQKVTEVVDEIALAAAWLRARAPGEANPVNLQRWHGDNVQERFGLSSAQVARACREAVGRQRHSVRDLKDWIAAVARTPGLGELAYRLALALAGHANVEHAFVWPSQEALAREIGVETTRSVRKAVAALAKAGAIRTLRAVDLPEELAAIALGSKRAGGSGRGKRGVAYCLVPPSEWAEVVRKGPLNRGPQRAALTQRLNCNGLRPDSLLPIGGENSLGARSASTVLSRETLNQIVQGK